MRAEPLSGFVLHHRRYQERRALITLLTPEHGLMEGVGRQNPPLFAPVQTLATGKRSLKTFSDWQVASATHWLNQANTDDPALGAAPFLRTWGVPQGEPVYAGLYANEVLTKLLPREERVPDTWARYVALLTTLATDDHVTCAMRWALRRFEHALLTELGVGIDWQRDTTGHPVRAGQAYAFVPHVGWQMAEEASPDLATRGDALHDAVAILQSHASQTDAPPIWLTRALRGQLDHALEHRPLQARLLWQDHLRLTHE